MNPGSRRLLSAAIQNAGVVADSIPKQSFYYNRILDETSTATTPELFLCENVSSVLHYLPDTRLFGPQSRA